MPPADQDAPSTRTIVTLLYVSAGVTAVVAIVLGALVSPILFAILVFALFDVWLARRYAAGRIQLARDPQVGRADEGGVVEGADPSYNPYARED